MPNLPFKHIRLYQIATILMLALAAGACQSAGSPPEGNANLIAYVGTDGNIYTTDLEGSRDVAVTDDAQSASEEDPLIRLYQNPNWAPDSAKLSFFRTEFNTENADRKTSVMSSSIGDDPEVTEIYSSTTELPIYSYWAPDSDHIGFLSFNQDINTMLFNVVDQEQQHSVLDVGQPYYWDWAPDSTRLVVHAGSAQSASLEHVSFLDLAEDGQVLESTLDQQPSLYQVPAWSPDGQSILVAIQEEDKQSLVLVDRFGNVDRSLLDFDESIRFGFSPDGSKVAALVGPPAINGVFVGRLQVFDLENPEEVFTSEEDSIIGFFWAPNSDDLAYFQAGTVNVGSEQTGGNSNQTQSVNLVNARAYTHSSGETRSLLEEFVPTDNFFTVLAFFNQYQHSATIWSPDSQNLLVAAETLEAPLILVVPASGGQEPLNLTNGVLAFWSWN